MNPDFRRQIMNVIGEFFPGLDNTEIAHLGVDDAGWVAHDTGSNALNAELLALRSLAIAEGLYDQYKEPGK